MTLSLLTADQTILKVLFGTDHSTLTGPPMLNVLSYIKSVAPFGAAN